MDRLTRQRIRLVAREIIQLSAVGMVLLCVRGIWNALAMTSERSSGPFLVKMGWFLVIFSSVSLVLCLHVLLHFSRAAVRHYGFLVAFVTILALRVLCGPRPWFPLVVWGLGWRCAHNSRLVVAERRQLHTLGRWQVRGRRHGSGIMSKVRQAGK